MGVDLGARATLKKNHTTIHVLDFEERGAPGAALENLFLIVLDDASDRDHRPLLFTGHLGREHDAEPTEFTLVAKQRMPRNVTAERLALAFQELDFVPLGSGRIVIHRRHGFAVTVAVRFTRGLFEHAEHGRLSALAISARAARAL